MSLFAAASERRYQYPMQRFASFALAAVLAASQFAAGGAAAAVGDWVDGDVVEMRLVATADPNGGAPVAAIEIRLDPGWKTYWRTPGEGGLPTVFDFGQSRNLTSAAAGYPAPRRYNDGWSFTNVYEGRVLFPVVLVPTLPTVPVTLHVAVDLGVCETICIPMRLEASVTLAPGAFDPEAQALIAEAEALMPAAPVPGAFEVAAVNVVGTTATEVAFEADIVVPQPFGAELFVEGPEGWFATVPRQTGGDGNRLTFAFAFERSGADAAVSGKVLTFTLVSAGRAVEQTVILP